MEATYVKCYTKQFMKIILLVLLSSPILSQNFNSHDIVGTWLPEDKSVHIHIYETNNVYYATATNNVGEPIRIKDIHNPDPNLRNRYISNILIIKDLVYNNDGEWQDGEIYDPSKGEIYSCEIKMVDLNTIRVTGYKILSMFWKYEVWRRIK